MTVAAYDIAAEETLLGLVMAHPKETQASFRSVGAEDWWVSSHQDLAAVLAGMYRDGSPIDPTTVLSQVSAQGLANRLTGPMLFTLYQRAWNLDSAASLADRIRNLASRRRLSGLATRLVQRLDTCWESGYETDAVDAIREFRQSLDRVDADLTSHSAVETQTMVGLMGLPIEHQWIIPGLIERQERLILTGNEGGGKTFLCSQLAVCFASGLHPFTAAVLGSGGQAVRVLVVDCENSIPQTQRRYRRITAMVDSELSKRGHEKGIWRDNMWVEVRPAGIDLMAGVDAQWLEQRIASVSPDVVVLGPLYKLHHANPSDETAARELVWVLDGLRERYGFALITEAHAGNASDSTGDRLMRPIGSSLFRRWPEFGFGLAKDSRIEGAVDVVAWRGSREERAWPDRLVRSSVLPWMPEDLMKYMADGGAW